MKGNQDMCDESKEAAQEKILSRVAVRRECQQVEKTLHNVIRSYLIRPASITMAPLPCERCNRGSA